MADKAFRLEKGEMVIFAKDFDLRITKAIVMKIFNKYTQPNEPMSYEDFKLAMNLDAAITAFGGVPAIR